jgi:hypothetical protein
MYSTKYIMGHRLKISVLQNVLLASVPIFYTIELPRILMKLQVVESVFVCRTFILQLIGVIRFCRLDI